MKCSPEWNRRSVSPDMPLVGLSLLLALAGCPSETASAPPPALAGPGVTFTSPRDGQLDVPVGSRVIAHFSDPVVGTLSAACTVSDAGVVGDFCLIGPRGVVPGTPVLTGTTVVLATDGGLDPGAAYQLYVRPSLVAGATNLTRAPLVRFQTRSDTAIGGAAPTLVAVNDFPLAAFLDGGVTLPFLDTASLRLVFSEPLDEATVTPTSVTLLKVGAGEPAPVSGTILAKGIHLTFDPDVDLTPNAHYVLHLSGDVKDLEGAPLSALDLSLVPRRTAQEGGSLAPQQLVLTPSWNGVSAPESSLSAMPVNTNVLRSNLLGEGRIGLLDGGITAQLGDPAAFGGPIPMVVRKGQRLDLSSLPIRFGGVLESGVETGVFHMVVLSDAVGYLTRNPLREATQLPDDRSPVFVDLTMDVGLYTVDPLGNTLANQTALAVRLLGTSVVDGDQLLVEQYASLELDTLGIGKAAVSLALQLRTGAPVRPSPVDQPQLTGSSPQAGAVDFPPDGKLQLTFSAPLDPRFLRDGTELRLTQGATAVPLSARLDGATVLVKPTRRLLDGAPYTLTLTGLKSLDGKPVGDPPAVSFTTLPYEATMVAPIATSLSVGAPCALTGATLTSGGRCVGSLTTVAPYQPFTLASNLELRAQFSQPMNPASMVLGATCGAGTVRAERLIDGECHPVPGTLLKHDRELSFIPAQPWVEGAAYRFSLSGGAFTSCSGTEPGATLCSLGGRPLNTTPLLGFAAGTGGPDIVIPFTATAATPYNYQPLGSQPFTDVNDDGVIESSEVLNTANRVAMEIAGVGGLVSAASLNGDDCLAERAGHQSCAALHAELPVMLGGPLASCPVDVQGNPSTAPLPCIQVRVLPNLITNTAFSMNTTVGLGPIKLLELNDLSTGMLFMRVREEGGPASGYILHDPGTASPVFVMRQSVSLDAPDLKILGGLVTHDLKSKPLDILFKGPVTFRSDGRINVSLRNAEDVNLSVSMSAASFSAATVYLRIPAGELRVTLAGPLVHQ